MLTINHEKGECLSLANGGYLRIEDVNVFGCGSEVEYLLQEEDEHGNSIGDPSWHKGDELRMISRDVWELLHEPDEQ